MRRTLVATVIGGLLAGLAAATPAVANTTVGSMTAPAWTAPVPAPVPGRFEGFPHGSEHTAFPTVTRIADGRLLAMWRHGSAHISDDGEILRSYGDPTGAEWTEPEHVVVDNGGDVRDPHLGPSGLAAVNGDVFLTYFVSVAGKPTGARVAKSTDGGQTFGSSVRIDPNYPWAAISSPVVKVNGKLWTSFYARQNGDTIESAYAAWSTDNGASWSSVRIAIGATGNPFQEPWTVAGASNSVVFIMRDGNWRNLASRSINSAGTWGPINRNVLLGATGNSASFRGSNGKIYTIFRDTVTHAAKLASSADNGVTFKAERELMPQPAGSTSGVGVTYAHPIELANGYTFTIMGMERSNTDSRLYVGYL